MDTNELKELYSFIRQFYKKANDKCKQLHKNNTYDPFAAGFEEGIKVCFAAFFQYISEDTMLQICTEIHNQENAKG